MKIKLKSVKNLYGEVKEYELILRNLEMIIYGNVVVDVLKEKIAANTCIGLCADERLELLKTLFYYFGVSRKCKELNNKKVLEYSFSINNVNYNSIIEELSSYPLNRFDSSRRKERVLYEVMKSYELVLAGKKAELKEIPLQEIPTALYSSREINKYVNTLESLLTKKGYNGKLETRRDYFEGFFGYYSNYAVYLRATYYEKK